MNKSALLTKDHESTYLKYLHRRYVEMFGHLAHKLDKFPFYITEIPPEIAIEIPGGNMWYPVIELASSLEKKGLVHFSENRTTFFLTELGYKEAEKGCLEKLLTWLNSNQGAIAAAAFIISIAGLFVGNC
jgi:hypothetical protein